MDRPQINLRGNHVLCSKPGCNRKGVYYCQQKNMIACLNCYQDHFICEQVIKIKTPKSVQQVLEKIEAWLEKIKNHGHKYYIDKFYNQFFTDVKDYEDKLKKLEGDLIEAQEKNKFLKFSEIKDNGYKLLKELMESNLMISYSIYFTQALFNISTNENFNEVEDPLQNEIRERKVAKLKEDLSKEMKAQFDRDVEAEKLRLKNEFEERYSQTYKDLKSEVDQLKSDSVEQKRLLDERIQENESLIHKIEHANSLNDELEAKLNESLATIEETKEKLDENQKQNDDLKKNYLKLEETSKENSKEFKDKIEKLSEEKKEKEEIIEKMDEESKNQQIEIEKFEKCVSSINEYVCNFYKSKTGRDGGTGKDFYMYFDWRDSVHKDAFNAIRTVKLNEIKKMYFVYIKQDESKELLDYLTDSCLQKLRVFAIDTASGIGPGDFYQKGFEKIASVTTKEVFIRCFKFSKPAFEGVFKASANSERIVFRGVELDLDSDIDISGPTYSTSYLSFRLLGGNSGKNWNTNPDGLTRIVKAISLSSLKDSLKTLDVYKCGVDVKTVQNKLKEFSLDHVNVVEENIGSIDG